VADARSFYITTPIYYVNGKPHIGHAYTTIAADVIARWHRLHAREVRFLTGTDEHGQKVLEKARERGLDPKAHADDMVVHWKAAWDRLDLRYDHFLRTTDASHIAAVKQVLQRLHDEGQIYRHTYTGWYCKADERFWTEKELDAGKCPECGRAVERIEETNWFFRMGRWRDALVAHIEANPGYIRPESRKNEVLGFLRKDLEDLCISRPKTRMAWGIEIPFDHDFVTYVWFDALLNYVSGVGYPDTGSDLWKSYWPADYHLIGKDILTTHAVYWSTMLMALGVPLPKCIYAHGWWTSNDGAKMSKSTGNVVDVNTCIDGFGIDATRYFLLRDIAFGADGGFTFDGFLLRYNADLANDLGNLAHRSLSMSTRWFGGVAPDDGELTAAEHAIRALAGDAFRTWRREIENLQFHKALEAVFSVVGAANKYIDTQAPWALQRDGKTERLKAVMRTCLEVCAFAGALLLPVMPGKAGELLAKLGRTESDVRGWVARLEALPDGAPAPFDGLAGATLTLGDPLFPRLQELPPQVAALFAAAPAAAPARTEKVVAQPAPSAPKKESPVSEPAAVPEQITYDDFAKVKLRVAKILSAEKHPNADKLLVLQVDAGEPTPRQIVAGIANKFAPEALVGRTIIIVANLKPAKLRGVESNGMLLAAGGPEATDLLSVNALPGEIVK